MPAARVTMTSDVWARLSLKAAAWAQPERAHGLSGGQAEPKPSEGARPGLGLGLGYGFSGVNLPISCNVPCQHARTAQMPKKRSFIMT